MVDVKGKFKKSNASQLLTCNEPFFPTFYATACVCVCRGVASLLLLLFRTFTVVSRHVKRPVRKTRPSARISRSQIVSACSGRMNPVNHVPGCTDYPCCPCRNRNAVLCPWVCSRVVKTIFLSKLYPLPFFNTEFTVHYHNPTRRPTPNRYAIPTHHSRSPHVRHVGKRLLR